MRTLVLLVDDYLDQLELSSEFLKIHGFDVLTAADGAKALEIARTRLPHVILIDLSLPVIDGLEVIRRLRRDPVTSSIRIIVLTAYSYEFKAVEAWTAGCDGFLTKPVSIDTMEAEIERVLSLEK